MNRKSGFFNRNISCESINPKDYQKFVKTVESVIVDDEDIPSVSTSFDTLIYALPCCCSSEYIKQLPYKYQEVLTRLMKTETPYRRTVDYYELVKLQQEYADEIKTFSKEVQSIIKGYTSLINYDYNVDAAANKFKHQKFEVDNNLAVPNRPLRANEAIARQIIDVVDFPTLTEYVSDRTVQSKMFEDFSHLFERLQEIAFKSIYNAKETDSYRKFILSIMKNTYGNLDTEFPRTIINHTAFKLCIEGYPFFTKNKRLFSVSNPTKNDIEEHTTIYTKNVYAILEFLNNMDFDEHQTRQFDDVTEKTIEQQTRILKNAFGVIIAIVALVGEVELHRQFKSSAFSSYKRLNG